MRRVSYSYKKLRAMVPHGKKLPNYLENEPLAELIDDKTRAKLTCN